MLRRGRGCRRDMEIHDFRDPQSDLGVLPSSHSGRVCCATGIARHPGQGHGCGGRLPRFRLFPPSDRTDEETSCRRGRRLRTHGYDLFLLFVWLPLHHFHGRRTSRCAVR